MLRLLMISLFLITMAVEIRAADFNVNLSNGVKFSLNLGGPDILAPPILLSVSQPGIIQSATFWIDMGPFNIEAVNSFQEKEFDVVFSQENQILKINIERAMSRTKEGLNILEINHDPFNVGDLWLGFGEFGFRLVEIQFTEGEVMPVESINGSWFFVTDIAGAAIELQFVSTLDQMPLEGFTVTQIGFQRAPNFFDEGQIQPVTDMDGKTYIVLPSDPHFLYNEIGGCLLPKEGLEITFIFKVDPPQDSAFESQILEVAAKPKEQCDSFGENIFPDKIITLSPKTRIWNWDEYENSLSLCAPRVP